MRMNKLTYNAQVCVLVILAVFLMSSLAWANTYYVDKNHHSASDSKPGSESQPWKTIQHAVDTAVARDTVYVKAGTYYESIDIKRSGSAGSPITFQNYTNDTVVIDGSNDSDLFVVHWPYSGADYIVWDGIDVRNGKKYGLWSEGNYNVIRNCKIYNNGTPGGTGHTGLTVIDSEYAIITNNDVYNNGWNGISVSHSNNATVEYNNVHSNLYHNGINIMPKPTKVQSMFTGNDVRYNICYNNKNGIYMRCQEHNEINNNLICENIRNGIVFAYQPAVSPYVYAGYTKVYNNTIVDNGTNGIQNAAATHLTIKNNLIAYNGSDEIRIARGRTVGHDIDYNLFYDSIITFQWDGNYYKTLSSWRSASGQDANSIEADPIFTDRSNDDYHITSQSFAIDKGKDLSPESIIKDLDGISRPQGIGFDIGAFEFGGSSSLLSAPQNFRMLFR